MTLICRRLVTFPNAFGGQPVPYGTERFTTDTERVVDFGRFSSYGDFVTRNLVKLDDGTIAQIVYTDNSKETERWLRKTLRYWKTMPRVSREVGWGTCWKGDDHA